MRKWQNNHNRVMRSLLAASALLGLAAVQAAEKQQQPHVQQQAAAMPVGATSASAAAKQPACFGEEQWQALQRSTAMRPGKAPEKALLYVWSPSMVFSAIHAHEVQQEAQALGLRFVPVHDGTVPAEEIRQALAVLPQKLPAGSVVPDPHPLQATQPLCAQSLVESDAYRHFPTAWVVQRGGFHPVPLVSAMPPEFWRMGMQQRLQPAAAETAVRKPGQKQTAN